jgi:hypothetical protein
LAFCKNFQRREQENQMNEPSKNPNPSIQVSGDKAAELAKTLREEEQRQLAEHKPLQSAPGPSTEIVQELDRKDKPFDQKIYMFPEEFNALRRELSEHHPKLWRLVAWHMGNNGPHFVHIMNAVLDMNVQFDTDKVGPICKMFLNRLRKHRGVGEIT